MESGPTPDDNNTVDCLQPLGMESGAIPDYSITASSVHDPGLAPYFGRLNGNTGGGGWAAWIQTMGQWLQVFPGNVDSTSLVKNQLDNPVDARYVRFVVQSWYDHIAMRVEILGCNTTAVNLPACPQPLGMASGAIPDYSITASSAFEPGLAPFLGRLNGITSGGGWAAKVNTIGQWLQVFPGNVDSTSLVKNQLDNPVDARYVRFVVQSWHGHIAMRVEILGCNTSRF
ncbi:lactadherin-like [Branchiostoma floridae]|uniref:Lactadherin-like n=1 Tax=Branchiostoma floridae TaxID=7739 RepID=A0A9J7LIH8_BRAFL|nr:lactadherin-like [Branchiostoma floridae]